MTSIFNVEVVGVYFKVEHGGGGEQFTSSLFFASQHFELVDS